MAIDKDTIALIGEVFGEDPTKFVTEFVEKAEGSEEETLKADYKDILVGKYKSRLDEVREKGKKDGTADILTAEDYLSGVLKNVENLAEAPKLTRKELSDALKKIQAAEVNKAVAEVKKNLPNATDLEVKYNELLSENGKVTDEMKALKSQIEALNTAKEEAVEAARKEITDKYESAAAAKLQQEQVYAALRDILNDEVEVTNVSAHKTYSNVAISRFMEQYDLRQEDGKLVAYVKGTNKVAEENHRDIDVVKKAKEYFLRDEFGFKRKEGGGTTPAKKDDGNTQGDKTANYVFPKTYDEANKMLAELMMKPEKDFNKIKALQAHLKTVN